MIERVMDNVLGNIDPMVIYICVGVLALCLVISIVKKMISFVFVTGILILGLIFLVPQVTSYQENFNIGVNEDNQLVITVDGNQLILGGEDSGISDIDIERQQNGWYELVISYDDESSIGRFSVPGFMRAPVLGFLDKSEIEYTLIE